MRTNKINNIFQEMVFRTLQLFTDFEFNNKDIEGLVKSFKNIKMYEVYLTFTFIFRPIRTFTKDYVYENILLASSNNYLVITILSIIIYVFIFIILCAKAIIMQQH